MLRNKILEKIYQIADQNGQRKTGEFLIDRFYISNTDYYYKKAIITNSTSELCRLIDSKPDSKTPVKKALVFMLRGMASQTLALYTLACAIKNSGFDVGIAICEGHVEQCGYDQEKTYLRTPPFPCYSCRSFSKNIDLTHFNQVSLNDYVTEEEKTKLSRFALLSDEDKFNYVNDGIHIHQLNHSFMLRYYNGNINKVHAINSVNIAHVKAGIKYVNRFKKLIDDQKPDCIALFNGLFFPENIFLKIAKEKDIPVITLECGNIKGTTFISLDEAACHYKLDTCWDLVKDSITSQQIEWSKKYLENRMKGPEDPSGIVRDVADSDWQKYYNLAKDPYIIFFAPVTHDTASMEKGGPFVNIFDALDFLVQMAIKYKKRLIIRSHPDEKDPFNPSKYSIYEYLTDKKYLLSDFISCFDSTQKWDPYKLAHCAQERVVFNGTLGIELPALGYGVYNLADSNYCNKGFTFDIKQKGEVERIFHSHSEKITFNQQQWALKYIYFYFFIACIEIKNLLEEYNRTEFRFNKNGKPELQKQELLKLKERFMFLINTVTPAEKI